LYKYPEVYIHFLLKALYSVRAIELAMCNTSRAMSINAIILRISFYNLFQCARACVLFMDDSRGVAGGINTGDLRSPRIGCEGKRLRITETLRLARVLILLTGLSSSSPMGPWEKITWVSTSCLDIVSTIPSSKRKSSCAQCLLSRTSVFPRLLRFILAFDSHDRKTWQSSQEWNLVRAPSKLVNFRIFPSNRYLLPLLAL
jgi:hypothetical protein